jgi:hypothetical protein
MSKLAIAKLAINVVTGVGVSKVVNDIIKNNVSIITNGDRIKVAVGSLVIGSMVAEAASNHVESGINKMAKHWKDRKATKEDTKEITEETIPASV